MKETFKKIAFFLMGVSLLSLLYLTFQYSKLYSDIDLFVANDQGDATSIAVQKFFYSNYDEKDMSHRYSYPIVLLKNPYESVFKRDPKILFLKHTAPFVLTKNEQIQLFDYFHCYLQNGPQEIRGINQFSLIRYNKKFEEISEAEQKWLDDFCMKCEMGKTDCRIKNLTDDWKKVTVDFIQKRNRNKAKD